jgi:general secretion pathway protein A
MYTSYFGLKENPFNLTPDPRYLFMSLQHREALNHLIYGINERKGFILITGGIGTGKTTISRAFLSVLDKSVDSALIFNPDVSDMELLQTINREFGVKSERGRPTRKRHISALNAFLLKNFAAGRNAVLLIDEAQNLPLSVLEQIRMLSNLETEREKLIQIVLLGQMELQELLDSPSLRQLNERITVRYDLRPLNSEQVQQYIEHRLTIAGGNNEHLKFSQRAYKIIYNYSKGIPRRVNAICDRALLIAYTRGASSIDKNIIRQAVDDIGGNYLKGINRKRGFLLAILLVFAILVSAGIIFRDNILNFLN